MRWNAILASRPLGFISRCTLSALGGNLERLGAQPLTPILFDVCDVNGVVPPTTPSGKALGQVVG